MEVAMRCCCHTCFIGQLSRHIVVEHDITVDSVNCCVFTFQWNISMAIKKKTGLLVLRQLLCRCPDHRSAGGTSENEHHHQNLISRDGICQWEKNVCKVACQLVPFTLSISEHFWIMKTVHVDSIVLWLCQTVEDGCFLSIEHTRVVVWSNSKTISDRVNSSAWAGLHSRVRRTKRPQTADCPDRWVYKIYNTSFAK